MRRDLSKTNYGGLYEATAGGAALKGEDALTCVKRELKEETGISEGVFTELGSDVIDERKCICHVFLCITNCDKSSIALQEGETMDYKWISEDQFIEFVNSGNMISSQKKLYSDFFIKKGYCKNNELY